MVLKTASHSVGEESQVLAQLQHSHIVPILSLHEDPVSGLHLFCMPYLGGANLAQLLAAAGAEATLDSEATGESLVKALDQVGAPVRPQDPDASAARRDGPGSSIEPGGAVASSIPRLPEGRPQASRVRSALGRYWIRFADWESRDGSSIPGGPGGDRAQPARRFLRRASFVQAAVWIAARLAEGLEHAHCRGLLHRDLKPANILITADGTPMILDFNLAAAADPAPGADDRLGGTLPYMAPEHLEAFLPEFDVPPVPVDRRADVYALGLILFEMAAGRHPFQPPAEGVSTVAMLKRMIGDRRDGPPSARSINPEIPWGLDSVLRKCLEPDPDRRYRAAGDLADDLVRLLEDRPLRFARETSPREYVAKFFRRNPRLSSSSLIAVVASILLVGLGGILGTTRQRWQAAAARVGLERFEEDFARCQLLLNTTIRSDEWSADRNLLEGLELVRETLGRYGIDHDGDRWEQGPMVDALSEGERVDLAERIAELIALEARAEVILSRSGAESARASALRHALRRLRLAERVDPRPPATLFEERAGYAAALGMADRAARDRQIASRIPATTARDYYLHGSAALAEGRHDRAEVLLDRSVNLEPKRFWSWFALGVCHFDQGRFDVAAADFAACTLLEPDSAWAHANRGLAMALDGRIAEAKRAYDRAIALDPDLDVARINRALVSLELDEPHRATNDLAFVLDRPGRHDPVLLAAWGEALSRSGRIAEAEGAFARALDDRPNDVSILIARGFVRLNRAPDAARSDLQRALGLDPRSSRAHLGIAHLIREEDPLGALEHLDAALDATPKLLDAVELRALIRARLGRRSALGDVDLLRASPTSNRLYNAACALSILSGITDDLDLGRDALGLLRRAIDAGADPAMIADDPDLDPIRARPEFQALLGP